MEMLCIGFLLGVVFAFVVFGVGTIYGMDKGVSGRNRNSSCNNRSCDRKCSGVDRFSEGDDGK